MSTLRARRRSTRSDRCLRQHALRWRGLAGADDARARPEHHADGDPRRLRPAAQLLAGLAAERHDADLCAGGQLEHQRQQRHHQRDQRGPTTWRISMASLSRAQTAVSAVAWYGTPGCGHIERAARTSAAITLGQGLHGRFHPHCCRFFARRRKIGHNKRKVPCYRRLETTLNRSPRQFSCNLKLERRSMRSYLATALILCGTVALLWSLGLGPRATASLAQVQPPPRPTLTAAPPTPIPPTAPQASATPRPRSDDDDDDESATTTATPTPTPEVAATPTVEQAATSSPTAPPAPTDVAPTPPQLPRTGDDAPARWYMALLGLALIAMGMRVLERAVSRAHARYAKARRTIAPSGTASQEGAPLQCDETRRIRWRMSVVGGRRPLDPAARRAWVAIDRASRHGNVGEGEAFAPIDRGRTDPPTDGVSVARRSITANASPP